MLYTRNEEPTEIDRLFVYFLIFLGSMTLFRISLDIFKDLVNRTERAYRTIEYHYVTEDKKVIGIGEENNGATDSTGGKRSVVNNQGD